MASLWQRWLIATLYIVDMSDVNVAEKILAPNGILLSFYGQRENFARREKKQYQKCMAAPLGARLGVNFTLNCRARGEGQKNQSILCWVLK